MSAAAPRKIAPMRWRWVLAGGWLALVSFIIFLANRRLLTPVFTFIDAHPGADKLGHFVLIGGMAFALNLALGAREFRCCGRGWLAGSALVTLVFALEEVSQLWIASRTFDWGDLAADLAGILFFGWLARRVICGRSQV